MIRTPGARPEGIKRELELPEANVMRLWGSSRYETALAVSANVIPDADYLFIASGRNFADAVSISPVVYAGGLLLILAGRDGLDTATQDLVIAWQDENPLGQVVILGGTSVVPSSVESQLGALKRPFRDEDGYFGGEFCDGYPSNWPSCPIDMVPVGIPSYRITRLGGLGPICHSGKSCRLGHGTVL